MEGLQLGEGTENRAGGDDPMMKLEALTKEQCEQVRIWRNGCMESLRTPYMLTQEQQERFYEDVVCNRNARARYWAVGTEGQSNGMPFYHFCGMIGLENIEWETGRAEISIMIDPELRGKGFGENALRLLLEQGFLYMGLDSIWGECYTCNPAIRFWQKLEDSYIDEATIIPRTKYWKGEMYDSYHFTITKERFKVKEAFRKCHK